MFIIHTIISAHPRLVLNLPDAKDITMRGKDTNFHVFLSTNPKCPLNCFHPFKKNLSQTWRICTHKWHKKYKNNIINNLIRWMCDRNLIFIFLQLHIHILEIRISSFVRLCKIDFSVFSHFPQNSFKGFPLNLGHYFHYLSMKTAFTLIFPLPYLFKIKFNFWVLLIIFALFGEFPQSANFPKIWLLALRQTLNLRRQGQKKWDWIIGRVKWWGQFSDRWRLRKSKQNPKKKKWEIEKFI